MKRDRRAPVFPVENGTWVVVLVVAVGFGVVSGVALLADGPVWRGIAGLFVPVVFAASAWALHTGTRRVAPVRAANLTLIAVALLCAVTDSSPSFRTYVDYDAVGFAFLGAIAVILQIAVVLVAYDSLRRLTWPASKEALP